MNRADAARARLLGLVIGHVAAAGIAGRSLREIAAGAGTSHRMLLYHFGSREGLLAAIVLELEARQRALLVALAAEAPTPRAVALAIWEHLTAPAMLPFVRLFFEVFGLVAADAAETEELRAALTTPWVDGSAAAASTLAVPADPVAARLGVAVTRGLLLDLVGGADPAAVDAAYRRFVDLADPASAAAPA